MLEAWVEQAEQEDFMKNKQGDEDLDNGDHDYDGSGSATAPMYITMLAISCYLRSLISVLLSGLTHAEF